MKTIALLFTLATATGFSTAIVSIRAGNDIFIAADSLIVLVKSRTRVQVCKLHVAGETITAVAGSYNPPKFDLRIIVTGINASSDDLPTKLSKLEKQVTAPAMEMLSLFRSQIPGRFREYLDGKRRLFDVLMVSLENSVPAMAGLEATVSPEGTLRFRAETSFAGREVWTLGVRDALNLWIQNHPGWVKESPLTVARQMIRAAEAAYPELVGGPISIVKLSAGGVRWIERGACTAP